MVMSSFFAGALMITFFAPASRCAAALSPSVKKPGRLDDVVDAQVAPGQFAGSRSASTLISLPSTTIASSFASTSWGSCPCTESYLSRCASVLASVRSLIATNSMSASLKRRAKDVPADPAEPVDP